VDGGQGLDRGQGLEVNGRQEVEVEVDGEQDVEQEVNGRQRRAGDEYAMGSIRLQTSCRFQFQTGAAASRASCCTASGAFHFLQSLRPPP
jgi:hypothetical protein